MYLWSFGKKLVCLSAYRSHVLTNLYECRAHIWGKGGFLITSSSKSSRLLPLPLQLGPPSGLPVMLPAD